MSQLDTLLTQIFGKGPASAGQSIDGPAWAKLTEAGLVRVGLAERNGGGGGELTDAATVTIRSAEAGVAGPLVECLFTASHLAAKTGTTLPPGIVVTGQAQGRRWNATAQGWQIRAAIAAVSWADRCAELWVVGRTSRGGSALLRAGTGEFTATPVPGVGEPRFGVQIDGLFAPAVVTELQSSIVDELELVSALGRSCQLLGALRACLHMSCQYTTNRHQFRRPLASHQVVQHTLAAMAGEVAAAEAAVAAAVARTHTLGTDIGADAVLAIAAAKVQTSVSATRVARSAHQLHGAMGLAAEYPLHHYTTRLWLWRDDNGSETYWAGRIAQLVRTRYGNDVWAALTTQSAPPPAYLTSAARTP